MNIFVFYILSLLVIFFFFLLVPITIKTTTNIMMMMIYNIQLETDKINFISEYLIENIKCQFRFINN